MSELLDALDDAGVDDQDTRQESEFVNGYDEVS